MYSLNDFPIPYRSGEYLALVRFGILLYEVLPCVKGHLKLFLIEGDHAEIVERGGFVSIGGIALYDLNEEFLSVVN